MLFIEELRPVTNVKIIVMTPPRNIDVRFPASILVSDPAKPTTLCYKRNSNDEQYQFLCHLIKESLIDGKYKFDNPKDISTHAMPVGLHKNLHKSVNSF